MNDREPLFRIAHHGLRLDAENGADGIAHVRKRTPAQRVDLELVDDARHVRRDILKTLFAGAQCLGPFPRNLLGDSGGRTLLADGVPRGVAQLDRFDHDFRQILQNG